MAIAGSGKTTILNPLGGLTRRSRRKVWIAGREISELPDRELARVRLSRIGLSTTPGPIATGRGDLYAIGGLGVPPPPFAATLDPMHLLRILGNAIVYTLIASCDPSSASSIREAHPS